MERDSVAPVVDVLHCDDFRAYTILGHRFSPRGRRNWEHPTNCAWDCLVAAIAAKVMSLAPGDVLLLEGHMLLLDPRILYMSTLILWLDVPQAICRARRLAMLRGAAPEGQSKEEYFDNVLWPAHEAYARRILCDSTMSDENRAKIVRLDCSELTAEGMLDLATGILNKQLKVAPSDNLAPK